MPIEKSSDRLAVAGRAAVACRGERNFYISEVHSGGENSLGLKRLERRAWEHDGVSVTAFKEPGAVGIDNSNNSVVEGFDNIVS